jgi:cation diffusion facilitator CzcD-associated flavoprotein CzcO
MDKMHFDVLIIGAGISGISAARHLQMDCPHKTFAILEGRQNIGGTWDLFKYPGIRSDSDMYTLGFRFRPWTGTKAIADGPSIMQYLNEAVDEYGIRQKIHFGRRVKKASWSTADALWALEVEVEGQPHPVAYTCNFVSVCAGYYNYEAGYLPHFEGIEKFKGQVVHPQKWTSDIDYTDKRVVVIGSGATAVTLVPELAKKAAHVTMLQRSPTYIFSRPDEDKLANWMNRNLPLAIAYPVTRWKNILMATLFYRLSKRYPQGVKKLLIKGIKKELGDDYPVEKHFSPSYNPWDQRVCLVPNGDMFAAIKKGTASVVTDRIDTFTETGIQLQSGEKLDAELIVTATGLNVQLLGGIDLYVDGTKPDIGKTVSYKSIMFSNIPNLTMAFGYTNASWTLKVDLTNQYMCRLLNYMDKKGYRQCTPRQNDPNLQLHPFTDFSAGYIQRQINNLPMQGNKKPWLLKQNYIFDLMNIRHGEIENEVLEYR